MKVHPISHAIFQTTKSGFIQILHYCLVSLKIKPLYFFCWNLIYFRQKQPIEVKFLDFRVVGLKFTKFLMSYLKVQVSFSITSHHSSVSQEITLLYFFLAETLYYCDERNPSKCQILDFPLHQIWTLISSFC